MNRTSIGPATGMVVGYALAAVGAGASVWNLLLERSVWLTPNPSMVWVALVFVGIAIVQMSELARIKSVLGGAFPKMNDRFKIFGIALVLSIAALLFLLK